MKYNVLKLILIVLLINVVTANGQDESIRPQLWNNIFIRGNVHEEVGIRGSVAYNVLLSDEMQWNELSFSIAGVYSFHPFMETSAGFYFAATRQSAEVSSLEYRPFVAYRIFSNNKKRWYVTNLSRFEFRYLRYDDGSTGKGYRFRNRTYAIVSLIKPSVSDGRNLFVFGYIEAFYNFGVEIRERFFYLFKYKLGLGYRINHSWRFAAGAVFQDSEDNLGEPVQLPVVINTNWLFEWGITYFIPYQGKKFRSEK